LTESRRMFSIMQAEVPFPWFKVKRMKKETLNKVLSGVSDRNIRFEDLRKLLLSFGFSERIKGDHHIFSKPRIIEIINLQPLGDGKTKAYQVKQVRSIILKYKLHEGVSDAQV